MARYHADEDWEEEDDDDAQAPDEPDAEGDDDSGDAGTIDCPWCGEEVYEATQRCPHCGKYLSQEDAPPARKPWWIVIAVALALAAVLTWILG